jgi:single-strand DNA-binding protein
MSTDINQVVLVGRLTRDAELRYTNSGTPVASLSIACNEAVKQQDGSWQEQGHFFDCTLWGKQAESVNQYLTKGRQVAITGRLRQEQWTDQQSGQNRSKVVINVQNIELLASPQGEQNQAQQRPQVPQNQGYGQSAPQYPPRAQAPVQRDMYAEPLPGPESFNDDIPF